MVLSQARGATWKADPIPEYNRLFQRSQGWIGADADYTVQLAKDRVLWLFGDTLLGEIYGGRRIHAILINNSVGEQRGLNPISARMNFFIGSSSEGKPAALILPKNRQRWFWPSDGVIDHSKLYIFLSEIERTKDPNAFGFHQVGTSLYQVSNPLDKPIAWKCALQPLPFTSSSGSDLRTYGAAILHAGGFKYIYGIHESSGHGKAMILARVPESHLKDFDRWRFYSDDGWSRRPASATDLCPHVANEYSVSWLPSLHRYVLICTPDGFSGKIIARISLQPWGPWSETRVIYHCPEATWNRGIFCYAAKAHTMLSKAPNEMVITYAANSTKPDTLLKDARLYWPRFIRIRF